MRKPTVKKPTVSVTVTNQKWVSWVFEKFGRIVFWGATVFFILKFTYDLGFKDGYIRGYADSKLGRPPTENVQKPREFRAEFSPK